jgi:hypothetical protein
MLQFLEIGRNGFDLKNMLRKKFVRAGVPDYGQSGMCRRAGGFTGLTVYVKTSGTRWLFAISAVSALAQMPAVGQSQDANRTTWPPSLRQRSQHAAL